MKAGIVGTVYRMPVVLLLAATCASAVQVVHAEAVALPDERAALVAMLQDADASRRLELTGHNPRLARQRVAAMSDAEVHALSERLKALDGVKGNRLSAFAAALMLSRAFGGTR